MLEKRSKKFKFHKEWIALSLVATALIAQAVLFLIYFHFNFADEDQLMMWYMAQDFLAGYFREPFFPGQSYSTCLESLLAVPLLAAGVELRYALPITSSFFAFSCYFVFAALAVRLGSVFTATTILAIPFILPAEVTALPAMPHAVSVESFLAILGIAIFMWPDREKSHPIRTFISILLLGLSIITYNGSIYLCLPVCIYFGFKNYHREKLRPFWIPAVSATLISVGLFLSLKYFYIIHPYREKHFLLPFTWELENLKKGFRIFDLIFEYFTPYLISSWIMLFMSLMAVSYFLKIRKWATAAFLGSFLLGVFISLGFPKVYDSRPNIFFSFGRIFIVIPFVYAFLLILLKNELPPKLIRGLSASKSYLTLALVVCVGWVLLQRIVNIIPYVNKWTPQNADTVVKIISVADMIRTCDTYFRMARENQAEGVYFNHGWDTVYVYGCGALWYGKLATLLPSSDRRTWSYQDELSTKRSHILIKTYDNLFCRKVDPWVKQCRWTEENFLAFAQIPEQSVLMFYNRLGLPIRRFE